VKLAAADIIYICPLESPTNATPAARIAEQIKRLRGGDESIWVVAVR